MTLLRAAILCIGIGVVWLLAGRQFALLLDQVLTVRRASLPVSPLRYSGGGFVIGGRNMTFGSIDNLRFPLDLGTDSENRLVLSAGGRSFTLGPQAPRASRLADIEFAPEPGDKVSFTSRQSAIGWPTPFEWHILIRESPWWKRYVYYQLSWEKQDGRKLRMLWRFERQYYLSRGWTEPQMMWNSQTGLLKVQVD